MLDSWLIQGRFTFACGYVGYTFFEKQATCALKNNQRLDYDT